MGEKKLPHRRRGGEFSAGAGTRGFSRQIGEVGRGENRTPASGMSAPKDLRISGGRLACQGAAFRTSVRRCPQVVAARGAPANSMSLTARAVFAKRYRRQQRREEGRGPVWGVKLYLVPTALDVTARTVI